MFAYLSEHFVGEEKVCLAFAMRLTVVTFCLLSVASSAVCEPPAIGRLADGQAYRISAQGYRLVDDLAELQVLNEELRQKIFRLEAQVEAQRQEIEKLRTTEPPRSTPRARLGSAASTTGLRPQDHPLRGQLAVANAKLAERNALYLSLKSANPNVRLRLSDPRAEDGNTLFSINREIAAGRNAPELAGALLQIKQRLEADISLLKRMSALNLRR